MFCSRDPQGQPSGLWRIAGLLVLLFLVFALHTAPAQAMKIQKVVSPKGIKAWLVEDHTLPLIAMQYGFRGGTTQDPPGKEGLAFFTASMLDEGAGDMTSQEFNEKVETLAINMSFDPGRDTLTGGLKTLTRNKDEAFRLLRLVLTEPRMDQDALDRVREQLNASIKMDEQDPEKISAQAWFRVAFEGHPYANPVKGNLVSIATITRDDLKAHVKRAFGRDVLFVAVVGDITAEQLAVTLDEVFGSLPAKAELKAVTDVDCRARAENLVIDMKVPQSVVTFGQAGLKRKDDDFIPAYILNYIIGGGGFSSKLMQEVREKRGLAYSVYTYLYPLDHAGIFLGGVATENKAVKQSMDVIREQLKRIASEGPTPAELENAKSYLTGSYMLRMNSSMRIATLLLNQQLEGLGIDYIDRRTELISAVTLDDIKRVAGRLIKPDNLIMTVVGQPEGLTSTSAKETQPAAGANGG